MLVKDLMTKNVDTLPVDISVQEALKIIMEKQISGLPVVDKNNNLVGMFTEKEVLKFCLPSYLNKVGSFIYKTTPHSITEKMARLKDLRISEVMRKDVVTVSEDADISEVSRIMLTQRARRMPVISDKKLVGIIARIDIVKYLAEQSGLIK